jgi:dihydrofolate reductase
MREVVYYLTQSVDGYIADVEGGVGWLSGAPNVDYGYEEFYHGVGTILFGSHTYEQICGFAGEFPYPDKEVVVYTSRDLEPAEQNVTIEHGDVKKSVARLKLGAGGPIWVGGGAELATTLLDASLIDRLRVFLQPIVLGNGISLTDVLTRPVTLDLQNTKSWTGGVVELDYLVLKSWRSDV